MLLKKFAEYLHENYHTFGPVENFMLILYFNKLGTHLDAKKRFYIYNEATVNNQLNDKHALF
jgi:hypothetical protein